MTELEREYTMEEVAEAIQMSVRWMRLQVANGAAHQRYGHKIRFTADQVRQLRARHSQGGDAGRQSITTGRKRQTL